MRPGVHFFEEYPTRETLAPASLVPSPTIVFLAARDWASFSVARQVLHEANPCLQAAWWPVLPRTLTLSAVADEDEIDQLNHEIRKAPEPLTMLLDLELPLWDRKRALRWLWRPKARAASARALDRLYATAAECHEVWTAEYPPAVPGLLRRALRLELPGARIRVYMLYSTIIPAWWRRILGRRVARRLADHPGGIGIGTLAMGVAGNERILSPEGLAADLDEAAALGASVVVLYRLGGLTPAHAVRLTACAPRLVAAPGASSRSPRGERSPHAHGRG